MAVTAAKPLLSIRNLDVSFSHLRRSTRVLRGVDLSIEYGEIHALAGESGSGKTVTALGILGLCPAKDVVINRGRILFTGTNLLELSEKEMRGIRGKRLAMVFQEPEKYLNPSIKVGEQISEVLVLHRGMDRKTARIRVFDLMNLVGLEEEVRVYDSYPHELSGGMSQRVMIAMGISCGPELLIADEPTTALDVTLQVQILRLIKKLKTSLSMSMLFITHNLGVVHEIADRVSIIYAGKIVETAAGRDLFRNPLHPYTQLLLQSFPEPGKRGIPLKTIPGSVPDVSRVPSGCAFHPRCPFEEEICRREIPESLRFEEAHNAACHMIGTKWTAI